MRLLRNRFAIWIIGKYLNEFQIGIPKIIIKTVPHFPPWFIPNLNICFKLNEYPKKDTPPEKFQKLFYSHRHTSKIDIFTDGSRTSIGTGAGGAVCCRVDNSYTCYKVKLNTARQPLTNHLHVCCKQFL